MCVSACPATKSSSKVPRDVRLSVEVSSLLLERRMQNGKSKCSWLQQHMNFFVSCA